MHHGFKLLRFGPEQHPRVPHHGAPKRAAGRPGRRQLELPKTVRKALVTEPTFFGRFSDALANSYARVFKPRDCTAATVPKHYPPSFKKKFAAPQTLRAAPQHQAARQQPPQAAQAPQPAAPSSRSSATADGSASARKPAYLQQQQQQQPGFLVSGSAVQPSDSVPAAAAIYTAPQPGQKLSSTQPKTTRTAAMCRQLLQDLEAYDARVEEKMI
ncbi:hypothetical protein DIPPA_25101 [Diplonema papillatum]|nr:hypothetical protein DIPPA_25101 [Diplonema papillatum]